MNRANDETSILMTNDESTIALTPPPVPSSNKSKIVKGLVALGCVAATVAVAGLKMAGTSSTLSPVDSVTLQLRSSLGTLLLAGAPMAFNYATLKGYCISQRADGSNPVNMVIDLCDDRAEDQSFRFYMKDSRMRPNANPGMCWTADRESGLLVLNECDRRNDAQLINYDTAAMSFRLLGTTKCLSTLDGEPLLALGFAECENASQKQKFELVSRMGGRRNENENDKGTVAPTKQATPPPPPPPPVRPTAPPLPTPPPRPRGPWGLFAVSDRGSDTQCVEPGRTTLACKDVGPVQALRYDGNFLQGMVLPRDRTSSAVALCMDAPSMSLQPCKKYIGQMFTYDDKLDRFRNSAANLCIVDKPDMKAAILKWCDEKGKPMV